MRAYYLDNEPGDPSLPHDSGQPADGHLNSINVKHLYIPIDEENNWKSEIETLKNEEMYSSSDIIEITVEKLGDQYEAKLKGFYEEHLHDDDEIRYVLSGSAYFDIREPKKDVWIRAHVTPGDLLVLPAGIYHRFTLDQDKNAKMMRLFKAEPVWAAHTRSESNMLHVHEAYLRSLGGKSPQDELQHGPPVEKSIVDDSVII